MIEEDASRQQVVRVAVAQDDLTARLLADLLRSRGVPAEIVGEFVAPVAGPATSDATVLVRRGDHQLASDILTQLALGGDADVLHCRSCDYALDDLADTTACPECGEPIDLRAYDRQGHCVACHYDLMGLPEATHCPECGLDLRSMGEARSRFTLVELPGATPLFVRAIAAVGGAAFFVLVILPFGLPLLFYWLIKRIAASMRARRGDPPRLF